MLNNLPDTIKKIIIFVGAFILICAAVIIMDDVGAFEKAESIAEEAEERSIGASMIEESIKQQKILNSEYAPLIRYIRELAALGDYDTLASALLSNEEILETFYDEFLGKELYGYNGVNVLSDLNDEYVKDTIVFTGPTTVFYGGFRNGKPSGKCFAVHAYELFDRERYDYTEGFFVAGVLNGTGSTGYSYLDQTEKSEEEDTEKDYSVIRSGRFQNGIFTDEVHYEVNTSKKTVSYDYAVEDGSIVIDERWQSIDKDNSYRLYANEDNSIYFELTEENYSKIKLNALVEWN